MAHASVYEEVTQKIIKELEQGTAPWVKPWQGGDGGMPYNATSQRRYSGVNVLLLWGAAFAKGYRHQGWLTFKQARALGGHVKKGEHGVHVVYASSVVRKERDETTGEEVEKKIPFLKGYTVFNVPRCQDCSRPSLLPFLRTPRGERSRLWPDTLKNADKRSLPSCYHRRA